MSTNTVNENMIARLLAAIGFGRVARATRQILSVPNIPAGWRVRVDIEDDRWLVYCVSPYAKEEFMADGSGDPTDAIARAAARARGIVDSIRARAKDTRTIYRMSERRPEGEWWWMWDARMCYWKQWKPGWGYDGCWTHWCPASLSAPAFSPQHCEQYTDTQNALAQVAEQR